MTAPSTRLAIDGGNPAVSRSFPPRSTIGAEEEIAVLRVLRSGTLSGFQGAWGDDFLGGHEVRAFEAEWAAYFGVEHAITVNSWTSGLIAMIGAVGVEPGDEVITTTWTMCATATAIVHWNAIPVFADVDRATYCIDPASVERCITERTRAILAVDIFGQSADMIALRDIADRHGIRLISDTAQAPGAMQRGRFAGTLADIGGFSLNYHKHIHTGEGGVIVTSDAELADRCRLIRNHAEAVVGDAGVGRITNMVGYNFRLGEIEAAIGRCQLEKLDAQIRRRQEIAAMLDSGLGKLPGLKTPAVAAGNSHVYYIYGMQIDTRALGRERDWVLRALEAEGVEGLATAYVNVHLLPMYQQRLAFGGGGYPWRGGDRESPVVYDKGICPVAEELQDSSYLGFEMCTFEIDDQQVADVVTAFEKVWHHCRG
jgi:dTDP-4-amino-4,6-dideoxygalactose transaminase